MHMYENLFARGQFEVGTRHESNKKRKGCVTAEWGGGGEGLREGGCEGVTDGGRERELE